MYSVYGFENKYSLFILSGANIYSMYLCTPIESFTRISNEI